MPTTTVHLVRHADPDLRGDDPGLSALDWSAIPSRFHEFLRSVPESEQDLDGALLDAAFSQLGKVGGDDQTVAIVTHGFVIGWFVRRALDAPWWRWIGLNQEYASITTIQWSSDVETRLLRFNDQQNERN